VRDKGKILFPASLHFQRSLGGIFLHGLANRLVEDTVQNVERLALQAQTILLGQIVNATAQDVVLGDDLFEIKSLLETLQTMRRRAASF
jgi:hypothetical protein